MEGPKKRKEREGRILSKGKRGDLTSFQAGTVYVVPPEASDPHPGVNLTGGCQFPKEY